jgi:hypothetical protein
VGDDGGFQGYNGLALRQGLGYFGMNIQILIHNETPYPYGYFTW